VLTQIKQQQPKEQMSRQCSQLGFVSILEAMACMHKFSNLSITWGIYDSVTCLHAHSESWQQLKWAVALFRDLGQDAHGLEPRM
jgi:hypothetical protein